MILFGHGRTKDERTRDKKLKEYAKYCQNEMDADTDFHESIYLDLMSKKEDSEYNFGSQGLRSNSLGKMSIGSGSGA